MFEGRVDGCELEALKENVRDGVGAGRARVDADAKLELPHQLP